MNWTVNELEFFSDKINFFVENYQGPKLAIMTTGGGFSLAELLQVPGSSRVVDFINIPYSEEAVSYMIAPGNEPAVSERRVDKLYNAVCWLSVCRPILPVRVAITAALTSNYPRRGENHVWIRVGNEKEELKFSKLENFEDPLMPPWLKRRREDEAIALNVLGKIYAKSQNRL